MDDANHGLLASLQSALCATSGRWTPAYAGALIRIRTGKLYSPSFKSFEEYCQVILKIHKSHVSRLYRAAVVFSQLTPFNGLLPANERQLRPLTLLPASLVQEGWRRALEKSGGKRLTVGHVEEAVRELLLENGEQRVSRRKKNKQELVDSLIEMLRGRVTIRVDDYGYRQELLGLIHAIEIALKPSHSEGLEYRMDLIHTPYIDSGGRIAIP